MKKSFNYQREEHINHNVGLMSFQHFNGEKLYADIEVKPENRMTETETLECYPVSPDAKEIENSEGYYPDASVAYIRMLWKEFEPRQNEYNYDVIEEFLKKADEHNQTVCFRLIAHSTRKEDDVPDWLKRLIPCPERPDGKRVKDSPTDHLFTELFCKAVRVLGARFDSDPRLTMVDICLPGAWGEGHKIELFGDEVIWEITEAFLDAFPTTHLMCQVAVPHILYKAREIRKVGVRGDGYGEPHHTNEVYPPKMAKVENIWKEAPVSFESYWWLGEWCRRGWNFDDLIEKSLSWHISTFNAKSLPIPEQWREKTERWISKMGYHYSINYIDAPDSISERDSLCIKLSLSNVGVAPIYESLPFKVRLVSGEKEVVFDTDINVRELLPGDYEFDLCLNTKALEKGKYNVQIGVIRDKGITYFATDAKRDGAYYSLVDVEIR